MKLRYSFTGCTLLLLLAFCGCKQELNVAGKYAETPVIYGLLNISNNTNYIRIEKGYLLQGNAYLATGIPDSIYYPNVLVVTLTDSNPATNTKQVFNLNRIDGNTVGLPKDSGLFSSTPNWLYSFNGSLNSNDVYLLDDSNTTSGVVARAQIMLVGGFQIFSPVTGIQIALQNYDPFNITWAAAPNGGLYDLTVRFFYEEMQNGSGIVTKDTFVDIPMLRSITSSQTQISQQFSQNVLINFLNNNLPNNPNIVRKFEKMNFMFAAGGSELASFTASQQAQSGIASSNSLPPYSNISGGVGLLSSRIYEEVDSVLLTSEALDTLACSSTSASYLRFKNSVGQICY
jgi:hypothetical protein